MPSKRLPLLLAMSSLALGGHLVIGQQPAYASNTCATIGSTFVVTVINRVVGAMDVRNGQTANGTHLQAWSTNPGGQIQTFAIKNLGRIGKRSGCVYEVRPTLNQSKCADATANVANEAEIIIWDCWGGKNQRWYIDRRGTTDAYRFISQKWLDDTNQYYCISRTSDENGRDLHLRPCSWHAHQSWLMYVEPGDRKV